MKKLFKKSLAVMLVVVMTLTAAPLGGLVGLDLPGVFELEAEAASYSGICGPDVTWTFNPYTNTLTIAGTGAMYHFSSSSDVPWESYSPYVETVRVYDGVSGIGNYVFYDFVNLTSVTLPDTLKTIGEWAFAYCESLKSVNIPNSVTAIGDAAFLYCENLTDITIPYSVKTIGDTAFAFCSSLASITVDNNNQYYSSDRYGVLFNKNKTLLIKYPIGNTRVTYTIPDSVTAIGVSAFAECYSLTSVTIPSSVTVIGDDAFGWCESLVDITIPDSVTSIGEMAFYNCHNLISITIPPSVKTIGYMAFMWCNSIKSVTIPDGVITIDEGAFASCESLETVTISASVTTIVGRPFTGCESLVSITVDENNQYYSNDSYGVLFDKNKTVLMQYPIGNKRGSYKIPDSVTTVADTAFGWAYHLESVTIPDSVSVIDEYAFAWCEGIEDITISSGVSVIGESAFYDCNALKNVYYDGVEEQWDKIEIGPDNEPLIKANIHFKNISNEAVIPTPSQGTINYGDSIVLHVDAEFIPEGGYVEWVASNNNFTMSVSEGGATCTISPAVSGNTTFTATVYDADGVPVSSDEQVMTSKAGFFQKLIAFFKNLFGLSKVFLQSV